ncbi:MAG TPA: peptidoglycan recognition family protein [Kofleriaceae bacterium]
MRLVVVVLAACSSSTQPREEEARPIAIAIAGDAAPVAIDAPPVDAAPPPLAVVEAPIHWTAERERLTLEYRKRHNDPKATDLAIAPRVIVLHYTGGGSAKATRGYFDNVRIEASRPALAKGGAVNVSAHYLVDRDGTIYRLQDETRFARHCIGLNHIAIGVENVGDTKKWPLTDAQVAANVALVRDLARRFSITHLLGHHEVMSFRDHAYFVEREPGYQNDKPDPGAAFMARVRAEVGELKLSGI